MVLDIRNVTGGSLRTQLNKTGSKKRTDKAGSSSGTLSADDEVKLTAEADKIGKLIAQMKAAPAVDVHRVAPVKEKVANDQYEIDYERVANKMLDFESDYYGY